MPKTERDWASLAGAAGSGGGSLAADCTEQNRHPRVQVSPRIMKVAVPPPQHSAILGQRASSHTVLRPCSFRSPLMSSYFSPVGSLTLSQSGLGSRARVATGGMAQRPVAQEARHPAGADAA